MDFKEKTQRDFEHYKRIVKFLGSAVIVLLELALYYYVWINFYNKSMEVPFWRRGNWLVAGEYLLLLLLLHHTYGGLKVSIYKYGTLVYSHMISMILINAVSYVQVVLYDKRMHNPMMLIMLTAADLLLVMVWAMLFRLVYNSMFPRRRLIIAHSENSMLLLEKLLGSRDDKYEIVDKIAVDEGVEKIIEAAKQYDGLIIGDISAVERNELIKRCYDENIRSYTVPKVSDILLRTSEELNIFDAPLYLSRNINGLSLDQAFVKRIIDILFAGFGLIVSSPIFLCVAMAIKLQDRGPVFYTQVRLTKDGREFDIYKFRTMVVNAEKLTGAVKAGEKDPRILPVGRILRATRLDELPQLLNILKGDMSLVGPRPERPELAKIIESNIPEFRYRLKVKAGLTGYAQVHGRYCTTSYDKLKLDLTYIRNYSVWKDLIIILMTPKVLFMKEATDGFEEGVWEDPALKPADPMLRRKPETEGADKEKV